MRIRRNILAPVILTLGTVGSLVAGPVLALTTTAAPATAAVAVGHATPNMVIIARLKTGTGNCPPTIHRIVGGCLFGVAGIAQITIVNR